jgi:hypothetical protein
MGMPARITGSAPAGAEFREARTGAALKIPAGKFSRNLPPGDYTIAYGGATRRVGLLAGGHYDLPLDAQRAIEITLSAKPPQQGEIQIQARLRGAGAHKLDVRAFNGAVDTPQAAITLAAGREQTVTWKLKIVAGQTPWAVVVIPDGDMSGKKELFGTARELARIE